MPATLAEHLGLRELVDEHLDRGARPGRANVGDRLLTLVQSALAGGDTIDNANAVRAGRAAKRTLTCGACPDDEHRVAVAKLLTLMKQFRDERGASRYGRQRS